VLPQVEHYLRALVDETKAVLEGELVGVYGAGSVALGAFEAGRSDIDVAVVCRSELPDPQKSRLVDRLRHEVLHCPARGLELVVYRSDVAASGTAEPGFEVELNTGAGMDFRATSRPEDRPIEDGLFWYGLDRSLLHQSGLRLEGPAASHVFGDLDPSDLDALLMDSLRWWIARSARSDDVLLPGGEDAVLGACRALVRHRSARWVSKVDAGLRLLADGYEPGDLIDGAIAARSGGPPLDAERVRQFQHQVLEQISGSTG